MAKTIESGAMSHTLPGIITDQPEIYESEPSPIDSSALNELDLPEQSDVVDIIKVPIKQAFNHFAQRENEIAKFYVQKFGEWKISANGPQDETEIEKYHRLNAEVSELLSKFQELKMSSSELGKAGALSNAEIISNLEVLSSQLKALDIDTSISDGSGHYGDAEFDKLKSRLQDLTKEGERNQQVIKPTSSTDTSPQVLKIAALEQRIRQLETLLGPDEKKEKTLFNLTRAENLTDAVETMSSWLSLFKPANVERVGKEVNYLAQKMEKIDEKAPDSNLDLQKKAKIDSLCDMVTSTDRYRALVPNILQRLIALEEIQQKALEVVSTTTHLEQVQTQIANSVKTNEAELSSLKEMFAKNIDLIKSISDDFDSRISAIN